MEWVVARELHKDGTPHLHAFVKYEKKVSWATRRWDIGGFHGEYEGAKSWDRVKRYCQKGDDFISSIDTESALAKKGKKNIFLMNAPVLDLVDGGHIHALQLPNLIKSRCIYRQQDPPYIADDVRGIWYWGPPDTGKSLRVRDQEPSLFNKPQNKWFDNYQGQKAILLDDFDKMGDKLSHLIKIWTDRYACTGEVKNSEVNLQHERFYITSNYHPSDIWTEDETLLAAITRRFKIEHMDDLQEYLGKRQPIN